MAKLPSSNLSDQDAAVYVRMSTEHQQYSTANQLDLIREFANRRGLKIAKTYSDEGKSGLSIQGRGALGRLIADVDSGEAQFKHILVYDVSRWGRFQDADESAYYEYVCRRAGIFVHYCAEQFDNDGSPISTIVKSVKRAMAAEFSRELSTKVFQGACRLIQLGFRQGGKPGFGYRRMLVGENGKCKGILQWGERKCIQTDHVILVPGPKSEVATVNWIFRQFVNNRRSESDIAMLLNKKRVYNHGRRPWNKGVIHELLANEKYIGTNVYHRHSCKLKKKHVTNPPQMWVRKERAFKGIVPLNLFKAAGEVIRSRRDRMPEEEMLNHLRKVLARYGKITGRLIKKAGKKSFVWEIRRRFGTLGAAYAVIGYHPPKDYSFKEGLRKLRGKYREVVAEIQPRLETLGCVVRVDEASRILIINEGLRLSIILCRHYSTAAGSSRWLITLNRENRPDLIVAVRMCHLGDSIHDYFILPAAEIPQRRLWLAVENGCDWDGYRFDTLEHFYSKLEQITLRTSE